jgi:hypothetical protein
MIQHPFVDYAEKPFSEQTLLKIANDPAQEVKRWKKGRRGGTKSGNQIPLWKRGIQGDFKDQKFSHIFLLHHLDFQKPLGLRASKP